LDPTNGSLLFANGGHEYPILLGSAGIKDQLATTGPAVGLIPGAQFGIQSISIEPGETLIAFTDGVTEARNSHREFYGRERLHTLLAQPVSTAAELLDGIMASVLEHMGGGDLSDDITMLAVRRQ
jgi:serine phosphatase RsbU (regulator of sigma subunit)